MKTRFKLFDIVKIKAEPGYTGKVIMVEMYTGVGGHPRYLVDCVPGAVAGHVHVKHPCGCGYEFETTANWFEENEIEEHPREDWE